MPQLYPLRFQPLFRRYLWGGRQLQTVLGKAIGPGDDYAESWEVVDRGTDQSRVQRGPLQGVSLGEIVQNHGVELLGRHAPQPSFPLLFKYLDAHHPLSLQVHPDDRQAARLQPPDRGKTEAWLILQADAESYLYAGLKRGFDRAAFERELKRGTGELCLNRISPQPGDCYFIPAGVVHALGPGLLVAEIQQSSDVTFRLWDWGRLGPDGRPRVLHLEHGLSVIDDRYGPVSAQTPLPTEHPHATRLVTCDKFILERWLLDRPLMVTSQGTCLLLSVLDGSLALAGDPANEALLKGETILLPACVDPVRLEPLSHAEVLVARLP